MLFKMNGVQELVNAEKEKRTSMNDVGTEDERKSRTEWLLQFGEV